MDGYRNVYKGEIYMTYIKFSYALNIAFTAFTYGMGMPNLFPLAAGVILVQWLSERISLARNVLLPPAMNDKMLKKAHTILKYAPIIMLCNGYWMIGNK